MFQRWLAAVREEVSGERALETVEALAGFHRVQASPGYDAACDWMSGQLRALGLEPEIERVPGDGRTRCLGHLMPEGWEASRAHATLIDGGARELLCDYGAEKLSLILRSAPARGRFPVVDVGEGAEDRDYQGRDVRGAVVLTRGPVQRVHELAVVERGAAGLLSHGRRLLPPVRMEFDDPDALAYTSFWWGEGAPRGWGFVVSPRVGQRLAARLAQGGPKGASLALELEIESRAFPTTIPILSTRIRGTRTGPPPGGTDEVLVVAHLCHPQPSANDNASGAAATLETARVLAAVRGHLPVMRRDVRLLWVPEITGTLAWLSRDPERAGRTAAAINLDMVGQDQERCGSTLLLEHPPHFAASFAEELLLRIRRQALDWVPSYSGPGHFAMTRLAEVPFSGGSDHYVLIDPATGVPCPMLIQWPDRYYHSSHDTPDKTSPASLALAVRCAATYAGFLAAAGEAESGWLLGAVARGARRRALAAVDEDDPGRALERERARGAQALRSLSRLGHDASAIESATRDLEEFVDQEAQRSPDALAVPTEGDPVTRTSGPGVRPRRRLPVPPHTQRHLLPGWSALPRAVRERWRAREAAVADGATLADLAWYACDGERTIEEIVGMVWRETGRCEPVFIAEFFTLMATLGLSDPIDAEEAACSPAPPDTASR